MPIEVRVESSEMIDLREFRRRVFSKVDPSDPATLMSVCKDIAALASNRNLLLEVIGRDLASWREHSFSMYSAQSCILDRFGPFTVRVNLWPANARTSGERSALSYHSYHDHNFSFVTTNFYGPGYNTDLIERDACGSLLHVGDVVKMCRRGERRLEEGTVVIYRKGVDIHAQIPPVSASASLNLIMSDEDVLFGDQFYYDPASSRVIGLVENVVGKRMSLIELGRYITGPASTDALRNVAEWCPCRRSSDVAVEVLTDRSVMPR
jgi:hypothetical protein